MKKLFIAAMMVVTVGSSAFALDVNKVNYRVKTNFEAQFAGAENVTWSLRNNYTKASFTLAEEKVDAFFSENGAMIAYTRKIELKQLPLNAIQKIKKEYASSTITESIEFTQDGEKNYYVSLQDGAKKQILQVSLYGSISVYNSATK